MKIVKQTTAVILILILFLVLYQNYDALTMEQSFRLNLHFIGWYTSPIPVWLIIFIAFAVGYAVAYVYGFMKAVSYRKRIKQLENELHAPGVKSAPSTVTGHTKGTESTQAH
ncbi:MAG: LapA family protein [Deltaproteobacteria bacterium]|nr:LapA family protein [Deltaproteobacteria bacterium]MCL5277532.1 LapA family protein [Deltaproteobacteria bacterium]